VSSRKNFRLPNHPFLGIPSSNKLSRHLKEGLAVSLVDLIQSAYTRIGRKSVRGVLNEHCLYQEQELFPVAPFDVARVQINRIGDLLGRKLGIEPSQQLIKYGCKLKDVALRS
jgi:hypothetical protein